MIRSVPIYDYRCDACGHAFSVVRSYSDGPVEKCPNCGKRPRKLLVAPAVVFKGSGWYKTDSRGAAPKEGGDSAKPAASSDTKSEAKTESKSEGPSESKSGTKSDSKSESGSGSKTESTPSADASTKREAKS
jgi:putative FmdB family regulatory protein